MNNVEMIGMLVMAASTLLSVFFIVHRPMDENTKAMTTLSVKVQQLSEVISEQKNDLLMYKDHVDESQRRQWGVINEHSTVLAQHETRLRTLEGE